MPGARNDLFERLEAFSAAAQNPALQVQPPAAVQHNMAARLLRNGLAVAGFALLEDFLKRRTGEALRSLGPPALKFSDLPGPLREAATSGALSSATFQARLVSRAGDDPIPFIQAIASDVASTASSAFRLSDMCFGYGQPNLGHEDVKKILKAFVVDGSWDQIKDIATRVGLGGGVSYEEVFRGAARMRNEAAHNSAADIAVSDLASFGRNATAIAIGFDLLLSRATRLMREGHVGVLNGAYKVKAAQVAIRFVDPTVKGWREWIEGKPRAVRRSSDASTLVGQATLRAQKVRQVVVLRANNLTPLKWYPTDDS